MVFAMKNVLGSPVLARGNKQVADQYFPYKVFFKNLCIPACGQSLEGETHQTSGNGAKEMVHRLRALTALPEDLSSISGTYMVAHNHL